LPKPTWRFAATCALVLVLGAGTRFAAWDAPLSYDPPLYLYAGHVVLDGGTPYVDTCCAQGPMNVLQFSGIRLVAGTSPAMVRLIQLLYLLVAALAVGQVVRRSAGAFAGVFAAACMGAFGAVYAWEGTDPNSEHFGITPLALAWWAATSRSRWAPVAAGAMTAAAGMVNLALFLAAPLILVELVRGSPGALRRVTKALCGALAVLGGLALWLAPQDALSSMVSSLGSYTAAGVDLSLLIDRIRAHPIGYLTDIPEARLIALGLLAAAFAAWRERQLRFPALIAVGWLVAVVGREKIATYTLPHHYYPALIGLAACFGLAAGAAPINRAPLRVATLITILALPLWLAVLRPEFASLDEPAEARFGLPPESSYRLASPVADFIRSSTAADDRIFVAGGVLPRGYASSAGEPNVLWLSERRSVTRWTATFNPGFVPKGFFAERRAALLRDPPAAIVAMAGIKLDSTASGLVARDGYRQAFRELGARVWLRPCEGSEPCVR
jgi:hypothetical protein